MKRLLMALLVSVVVHTGLLATSRPTQWTRPSLSLESGVTSVEMSFQSPPKSETSSDAGDDPASESRASSSTQQNDRNEDRSKKADPEATSSSSRQQETSDARGEADEAPTKSSRASETRGNPEDQADVPESLESDGAKFVESVEYRHNPPPKYPPRARALGVEGRVELLVEIDARGHPTRVAVHESSGSYRLDDAARSAVRRWEFVPAREDGQPVESRTLIPVTFHLE